MVVGIKDIFKMLGIFIISCCAVCVCTLFLNYNIDLFGIKPQIISKEVMLFYNAQVMSGKVVSGLSGGCLLLTSVVMLFFYIKHYIDVHRKELGILKALGYSNLKIAIGFWRFGISILLGTAFGFCLSFCIMPLFYKVQNEKKILPGFTIHFHPEFLLYLVILPAVLFSILSVIYGCYKLKAPVMELIRERNKVKIKREKKDSDLPFLKELRKNTIKERASLIFFIAFATFCYSSMMQMAFSMNEMASAMMSYMIMLIGIILSCSTLFLAITTVINANNKNIAMMRVFGYTLEECSKAILGGYRLIAYIGFAIGTVYQYGILKFMIYIVFKDIKNVPDYNFNLQAFFIALFSFAIIYEIIMYLYTRSISKISIKENMLT